MAKKLLIACFDFPPNPGIGGRRWAKFAKGLVQAGYEVHVVKSTPYSNEQSAWSDVLDMPGLTIHSVKRSYPQILSAGPKNTADKILYHLARLKIRLRERGTIYDQACGWEKPFSKKALELIEKHAIHNVLATGAPFNLLYYATRLKRHHPELHVLCDLRDPWISAVNYGMTALSDKRRANEQAKFDYIMEHADVVTCPNEYLLETTRKSCKGVPKAKLASLPHLIDFDDLPPQAATAIEQKSSVRMIYAGALYVGLEPHLDFIRSCASTLAQKWPETYGKWSVDIYTPDQQHAWRFENTPAVRFHKPIGKAVFDEVSKAAATLVILADHNKDFLTTKFFEYLAFRKPILYIGAEGEAARFIESSDLGRIIRTPDDLARAISDLEAGNFAFNHRFDLSRFGLQARTQLLIDLLK